MQFYFIFSDRLAVGSQIPTQDWENVFSKCSDELLSPSIELGMHLVFQSQGRLVMGGGRGGTALKPFVLLKKKHTAEICINAVMLCARWRRHLKDKIWEEFVFILIGYNHRSLRITHRC